MNLFSPVTIETAPDKAKPILEAVKAKLGFVPNLYATFANSPAVLESYTAADAAWNKGELSATERQIILLTTSKENSCGYCVAAHSTILKKMLKADPEIVAAVRENRPLADKKLEKLRNFTRSIVKNRGHVEARETQELLDAGYSKAQLMEVLVGVALKTISNYLDHISPAPLDEAFAAEK